MVELAQHGPRWEVSHGGDTLNTALHLARLGHDVAYLTALGGDPFAGPMRAHWAGEGMDLSLVLTVPDRRTGLYAISTDEHGERRFSYWRGESAARALFAAPGIEDALERAREADLLFFSLISLAILPGGARERVVALAARVRARGGKVAFDGNYRPPLWESAEAARRWRDRAAGVADFGFPSVDDEAELGVAGGAEAVREHWLRCRCGEVVVKLGAQGVMLPDGTTAPPPVELQPLDTSGAGDAFDAGYLAARLNGAAAQEAAEAGQRLAGWTVMRQGAIPPRDPAAPYPGG
jgi:2-dehydro-3-deoxygluconokinase